MKNFSLGEGVKLNASDITISNFGGTIGVGLTDPNADVNLSSDTLNQLEAQELTLQGLIGVTVNGLNATDLVETVTSLELLSNSGSFGSIEFLSTPTNLPGINLDVRTTGVATVNAPVNAENISFAADDLILNAAVSGSGQLTIQHAASSFAVEETPEIGIGNQVSSGLNIGTDELDFINDGFSSILFSASKSSGSDGSILIGNAEFQDPVEFRTGPTGSIVLNGRLITDGSVSFNGENDAGVATEIRLEGSIHTSSEPITITQNAVLDDNLLLNTTFGDPIGAFVDVQGTIEGAHVLVIRAGSGNISLSGAVGAVSPLSSVLAQGANISLNGVTTTEFQFYDYDGTVTQSNPIKAENLILSGTGPVILDDSFNDISNLSAEITGFGQGLVYQDSNSFQVIDGDGIRTNNGHVTLNSPGQISIFNNIETNGGDINLNTDLDNPGAIFLSGSQLEGEPITTQINTNGGNFNLTGKAFLASDTTINTDGGSIDFNGPINGNSALNLSAGGNGNIQFRDNVGTEETLGPVAINSANDVTIDGRFVAGDTRVMHSGDFTTSDPDGFLELESLFVNSLAKSANLKGTVGGAADKETALLVQGPKDDANFKINDCVIGISCSEEPVTPGPVIPDPVIPDPVIPDPVIPDPVTPGPVIPDLPTPEANLNPDLPTEAEPRPNNSKPGDINEVKTAEILTSPTVLTVVPQLRPSNNPVTYQYSNFGNTEMWDDVPGAHSVSSFAAFSPLTAEKDEDDSESNEVELP